MESGLDACALMTRGDPIAIYLPDGRIEQGQIAAVQFGRENGNVVWTAEIRTEDDRRMLVDICPSAA